MGWYNDMERGFAQVPVAFGQVEQVGTTCRCVGEKRRDIGWNWSHVIVLRLVYAEDVGGYPLVFESSDDDFLKG